MLLGLSENGMKQRDPQHFEDSGWTYCKTKSWGTNEDMSFGILSLSGRASFQRNMAELAFSDSSCKDLFDIMVLPYLDPNVSDQFLNIIAIYTDNARAIGSTVS
jgi:hypothetical protein